MRILFYYKYLKRKNRWTTGNETGRIHYFRTLIIWTFSFQSDDDWKVNAEKKPRPISSGQQIDKNLNPPRHLYGHGPTCIFFVFFLGRGIYQINILFFFLIIDYYFFYKKKIQMENGYLGCLSHSCVVIRQKGAQHFRSLFTLFF